MSSAAVEESVEETAEAIAEMEVRGAATIAREAAGALCDQATESDADDAATLSAQLRAAARRLRETRPTAVSLPNALRYVLGRADGEDVAAVRESVVAATEEFLDRLDGAQERLGAVGANRLTDGDTVMTHCHSTDAVAIVRAAIASGKDLSAVVKETRPRRQGEITARRLRELDVPVTFIVDGAAHRYLREVDHVLVGADSIAVDGTVVNKIGTSGLAVSARERDVDFVVAAQTLKLDPRTLSGHRPEIEHRDASEVLDPETQADLGVEIANPAFDATPPRFLDAIVTEEGVYAPNNIGTLLRERYGSVPIAPWEES